MTKNTVSSSSKEGAPPGTLLYTGDQSGEKIRITVLSYNTEGVKETELRTVGQIKDYPLKNHINWINVDGVHDPAIIETIGEHFGIHPLVLEDILNTRQRPKVEDYGDYLYFVIRMVDFEQGSKNELMREQVSIILGKDYILSFQEKMGDVFDPIRNRIRAGKGKMAHFQADFLGYLLLDSVVDQYFNILENLGGKIDKVEEQLIERAKKETLQEIYILKRKLIFLRESVWPLRDTVASFQRLDNELVTESIDIYLRDFNDHVMRVIDTVETYRDTTSSMVDLYLSTTSIKMNEVMKVLTVISTIFIPLTFITGFYGMNIDLMPGIHSEWTYPGVMIAMGLMVVFQLIWFRRKKWL